MAFLIMFIFIQTPTAESLGLPSADAMAAKALAVAEQNLPQITMVGLSIFIVRKMLNEM